MNKNSNIIAFDSERWEEFVDCLFYGGVITGLLAFLLYRTGTTYAIPSIYPAGIGTVLTFAMLALAGHDGAYRDTVPNTEGPGMALSSTILGAGTGFILGFIGGNAKVADMNVILSSIGAAFIPLALAYPLLKRTVASSRGIIRGVFRPTLPHLMLWMSMFITGDPMGSSLLGALCMALESAIPYIACHVDNKTKDFAYRYYPVSMILTSSFIAAGSDIFDMRRCMIILIATAAGIGTVRSISRDMPHTAIQIIIGVGVSSLITIASFTIW